MTEQFCGILSSDMKAKTYGIIAVVVLVIAAVGVLAGTHRAQAPAAPAGGAATTTAATATTTNAVATSTSTSAEAAVYTGPFPINPADAIASWSFKGAYTGNATLVAQANADIAHLTSLLGTGKYDDYDLYNGIGNDYNLLGDGQTAYRYYDKAAAVHPGKGLVYTNLGHLFDELGAYYTAADAYAKAVHVEPSVLEYHVMRLTFLTARLPKDNAAILAALSDASKQFGDTPAILSIEAEWLEGQGRYADAIKAWQTVKMLSPAGRQASIQAQIERDQAKL